MCMWLWTHGRKAEEGTLAACNVQVKVPCTHLPCEGRKDWRQLWLSTDLCFSQPSEDWGEEERLRHGRQGRRGGRGPLYLSLSSSLSLSFKRKTLPCRHSTMSYNINRQMREKAREREREERSLCCLPVALLWKWACHHPVSISVYLIK